MCGGPPWLDSAWQRRLLSCSTRQISNARNFGVHSKFNRVPTGVMNSSGFSASAGHSAASARASQLAASYRSFATTTPNSEEVASMIESEKQVLQQIEALSKPQPLPQWRHATALHWQLPALPQTTQRNWTAGVASGSAPSTAPASPTPSTVSTCDDFSGRLTSIRCSRSAARAEFDQLLLTSQRQRRSFAIVEKRLQADQACNKSHADESDGDSLAAFPHNEGPAQETV